MKRLVAFFIGSVTIILLYFLGAFALLGAALTAAWAFLFGVLGAFFTWLLAALGLTSLAGAISAFFAGVFTTVFGWATMLFSWVSSTVLGALLLKVYTFIQPFRAVQNTVKFFKWLKRKLKKPQESK